VIGSELLPEHDRRRGKVTNEKDMKEIKEKLKALENAIGEALGMTTQLKNRFNALEKYLKDEGII
jgi:hypothetical protein